jgi:hypothetical protein
MAKRLSKPVRFMLLGVMAIVVVGGVVWMTVAVPRQAQAVRINPTSWTRIAAGERIEVNGYTFEMPIDGVYSRLDGSHGPDLEGALLIRENANRVSELVVGRISQLTPETTIHPDRIGKLLGELIEETRSRDDDLRLMTVKARRPELPDRVLALCLPADAYLWSDGITFDLGHMTTIMESWAPVEADAD